MLNKYVWRILEEGNREMRTVVRTREGKGRIYEEAIKVVTRKVKIVVEILLADWTIS